MSRSTTPEGPHAADAETTGAGPSRLQYPPQAHIDASRADRLTQHATHSSSSLFWRGDSVREGPSRTNVQPEEPSVIRQRPRRRSSPSPLARRKSTERIRPTPASQDAASIDSSKSGIGGWVDWLSGKSTRAAERAEASRRLGKKLKRAEKRSRMKKQMASRHSRRSISPFDDRADSDSDVVMTRGDEIVRPEQDVPPPNETTANALTQVATKGKQPKVPRLHFAPEELKIRRKDLPQDYEQGELYRGLDDYVQASRSRRRRLKRSERRKGSKSSSRASRSSYSKSSVSSGGSSTSSSEDDSDDGSSSTGSSSSSASGRLTMARLRAFFGDSSSSDSSSSSNSSDDSSSSTSRSGHSSHDSDSGASSNSRSTTSKATFRLFRRRRQSRTNGDSDAEESPPGTPRTPRTPALNFQLKGRAQKRRRKRAAQRFRAQEKRLIEEGKIPPKPSRKARKKAKMAKMQAGGITEYTLFTPIALAGVEDIPLRSRSAPESQAFTQQRVDVKETRAVKLMPPDRVLQTVSFPAIKERLHALRRHRRQIDNAAGDIGLPSAVEWTAQNPVPRKSHDAQASGRNAAGSETEETADRYDFDFGDLSLPPPALDLPEHEHEEASSNERQRRRRQRTQWHMSDMPLTPHVQMASEFERGFEVGDKAQKGRYKSTLETHVERGAVGAAHHGTPSSDNPSDKTSSGKLPSGESSTTAINAPSETAHAAWWLDINCPTYRDMTELSKMFPLHPLTVEDILQQDTREKVEVFERLNYYFVVVRAIDEKYFKFTPAQANGSDPQVAGVKSRTSLEKDSPGATLKGEYEMKELHRGGQVGAKAPQGRVDIVENPGEKEGLEGVSVGAINLYLIVFSHGIISFHFEDVSKHTNHVRSRLLDLTQPVELTSDWIAHGIFDSIVDAFFPLLTFVQTEVEDIERLTDAPLPRTNREAALARKAKLVGMEKRTAKDHHSSSLPVWVVHEKQEIDVLRFAPHVAVSSSIVAVLPTFLISRRERIVKEKLKSEEYCAHRTLLQRFLSFGSRRRRLLTTFQSESAQEQKVMLRRITETRKIVTGLSRLLSPKNDSVRGLRKRLVDLRSPSLSTTEMSIYMGDVHDHIVTLLSHLASGDHRLSDIHISYLSVIRMANSLASHSKDQILVFLATITVTIVATVFVISMFSVNVNRPGNELFTPDHHWFGGVVAAAFTVPWLIGFRTYFWVQQAKQKSAARRAIR